MTYTEVMQKIVDLEKEALKAKHEFEQKMIEINQKANQLRNELLKHTQQK